MCYFELVPGKGVNEKKRKKDGGHRSFGSLDRCCVCAIRVLVRTPFTMEHIKTCCNTKRNGSIVNFDFIHSLVVRATA